MDELARKLVIARVAWTLEFGGLKIKPIQSTNGCKGCIFETPEKAEGCKFKCACMAHLRRDNESVVFANGTIK